MRIRHALLLALALGIGAWIFAFRPERARDAGPVLPVARAGEPETPRTAPSALDALGAQEPEPARVSLAPPADLEDAVVVAASARVAPVDPPTRDVENVLIEVLSLAGEPLGGAAVSHVDAEGTSVAETLTDADGRCSVSAARDDRVHASKAGIGTSGELTLRGETEVVLVLAPQRALLGQVLSADGLPVARAAVTLFKRGVLLGGSEPRLPSGVVTDGDGRFRVLLDRTAARLLAVASSDGETTPAVDVPVEEADELRLQFAASTRTFLRLVTPSGDVLTAGELWIRTLDADPPRSFTLEAKGERTEVREPLQGRYAVAGTAPSWAPGPLALIAFADDGTQRVIDVLVSPPVTISGRVVDGSREPLAEAAVVAWADPVPIDGQSISPEGVHEHARATTDASGRFEIGALSPAVRSYSLGCAPKDSPQGAGIRIDGIVPGASDVEIVVTEQGLRKAFAHGSVTLEDGTPVGEFTLILHRREAGAWRQDRTVLHRPEQGPRFEIVGLTPGVEYCLIAHGGAGSMAGLVPPWTASLEGTPLAIVLPAPRELVVRVVDRRGDPRRRMVQVERELDHARSSSYPGSKRCDHDGKARFAVSPGSYLVSVVGDGAETQLVRVEIDDADTTEVSIEAGE